MIPVLIPLCAKDDVAADVVNLVLPELSRTCLALAREQTSILPSFCIHPLQFFVSALNSAMCVFGSNRSRTDRETRTLSLCIEQTNHQSAAPSCWKVM